MVHDVVCHWCKKFWQDAHPDAPDATIWCGDCDREEIEAAWKIKASFRAQRRPRHSFATLMHFATDHTWGESTHEAGRMAIRMKAALEMALLFHRGGAWTQADTIRWIALQNLIGVESTKGEASTKTLCNVLRDVLGDAPTFCNQNDR